MYDQSKDIQISVSVGVKAAVELAAATDDPFGHFNEHVEDVVRSVLLLNAQFLAEANLGATPAPQVAVPTQAPVQAPAQAWQQPPVEAAYVPQPQAYPPAAPAPAPIPLAGDGGDPQVEQLWVSFFNAYNNRQVAADFRSAREGQWFDNRLGKSPNAPDFKIKGAKGERTAGLYISDKKAPQWVDPALRQVGLA